MPRLPPVDKLPLTVRKNIRDEWDNKKNDRQAQLSEALGESWTIDISPNQLYAYARDGEWAQSSTGSMIHEYVLAAIDQLKSFISRRGDDAKAELNAVCPAHVLTIDIDDANRVTYNGCTITADGKLAILFGEQYLGVNISDALEHDKLLAAINAAPVAQETSSSAMSYVARDSIKNDWEPRISDVQTSINTLLQSEIALEPNFDHVYAHFKDASAADPSEFERREQNLGNFMLMYFQALARDLQSQGFGSDDMLREGFLEGVESRKIVFRIVEKSKMKASYNETVLEDGVLYMQTSLDNFGTNIDDIARNIVELL